MFHLNVKVDLRETTRRIRPSVHLEPHYSIAGVATAAVLRSLSHVHLNLHLYLHMQCTYFRLFN